MTATETRTAYQSYLDTFCYAEADILPMTFEYWVTATWKAAEQSRINVEADQLLGVFSS